jgi:hypothetical protein
MTIKELMSEFLNYSPKERKIGRYNASEIYGIIKGYNKPKDFKSPHPIKPEYVEQVIRGMGAEDMMSRIFEERDIKGKYGKNQSKYELDMGDGIVIVCKPDVEFEKEVWEFKYPKETPNYIPDKWKYQLECEYRATHKPVKLMVFTEPFGIIEFSYVPSEETWEEIKTNIKKYDEKIKKIFGKENAKNN